LAIGDAIRHSQCQTILNARGGVLFDQPPEQDSRNAGLFEPRVPLAKSTAWKGLCAALQHRAASASPYQ
jgi:hypothetical protein